MGILIGPTPWWQSLVVSTSPVGSTLPDGSRLICKAGGTAWIVAPANTQVCQTWNNSTSTQVGNKCSASDWPTLCTCLISRGLNPSDWFVPSQAQLANPLSVCRAQWAPSTCNGNYCYWSSTEINATNACYYGIDSGIPFEEAKTNGTRHVRAFRCVTY